MIVTFLILGGCVGLLCAGFCCRTRHMSCKEWEYRKNNKISSSYINHFDDWYRYL